MFVKHTVIPGSYWRDVLSHIVVNWHKLQLKIREHIPLSLDLTIACNCLLSLVNYTTSPKFYNTPLSPVFIDISAAQVLLMTLNSAKVSSKLLTEKQNKVNVTKH